MLLLRVFLEKQNLSLGRPKSGFLISNSKLVLKVLVGGLPTALENFPLQRAVKQGSHCVILAAPAGWTVSIFPAHWEEKLGNIPASAGASKWPP